MSNEKKNPLIGAFRAPPVGTPPSPTQPAKQPETPENIKAPAAPLAAPILTKLEESKKPAELAKDDKTVKDGKPAAAAPAPAKPGEAKKPAEPAKDDKAVKDGKPAAATPAPVKPEENKKPAEPAKDDKAVKDGKPAATAPAPTKPEEAKKPAEPTKDDKTVKDGKPAAAAPAPTKPEESKKPAEPAKVDEVKEPVGQETPTASATRTADGPKGSAVTKVFEDRLDAPTEADLFKLPTPGEGEIYSMAVHPAYLKDFLDHPFGINRETQDYKDLFESIKNYGIREPVLCRPGRSGGLEIISGHRRHDIGAQLNYPIDILPIPTDEAIREVQSRILGIESDIARWQQRQNSRNNFTASIPYELEQLRAETKEFLDDLSTRDQRMIFANVTIVHMADTLEQLNADTETLQAIGLEQACQFSILRYQQEDGLNTALPYGLRRIKTTRTLTTESTAVLMPFRVQEIQDAGGIYYGVNAVSRNLLICNRKKLLNPHGFVLGVSGSGKSFSMKEAITFIALSTNDDIIMIDAEREYGELTRALQGAVLEISPSSPNHINPLEINRGYGAGENPVAMKSELMMSICEQQMGVGQLGAFHKSIIDRCTANIYHDFIKNGGEGRLPTLPDWRNEVKRQPEREAQELALASELFVEGSLNMFAHETNFDIDNRIVCFDLYEMGEQLKPTALNVVLETIQNRVAANRLAGKYTWVFVDEVYLFFKYHYSAQFLYKCWKRFRKYAAAMTAATQNIEECLRSETARLMLANSEFLILLNQAATDRAELAKLLHISETQMSHVTNVEAGHGLMRIGSSIIPFINEFPRDSELYRLMSTTPGDK